jgi:hypothetical protein
MKSEAFCRALKHELQKQHNNLYGRKYVAKIANRRVRETQKIVDLLERVLDMVFQEEQTERHGKEEK